MAFVRNTMALLEAKFPLLAEMHPSSLVNKRFKAFTGSFAQRYLATILVTAAGWLPSLLLAPFIVSVAGCVMVVIVAATDAPAIRWSPTASSSSPSWRACWLMIFIGETLGCLMTNPAAGKTGERRPASLKFGVRALFGARSA